MRIRTLFLVTGIFAGGITVILGVGAYLAYRDYSRAYSENRFANNVTSSVQQLSALTSDFILYPSERPQIQWARKNQTLSRILQAIEIGKAKPQKEVLKIRRYHEKLGQLFNRYAALHSEHQHEPALIPQEIALASQLQTVIQLMASEASRHSNRHQLLMEKAENRMILLGGTFVGVTPITILFMWLTIAFRVIGPIQNLKKGIYRFGRGDLMYRFPQGSRDEIADVATAFNNMAETLNTTMASRDDLNKEISERKHVEEKLLQSQKMEAVGQLTGGIAHDFNNLLNIVMGKAELLGIKVKGNEKAQHDIEGIIGAVQRGASLTERLLAFSRQQTLSPQPTAVNELVHGLEDMLRRTLGETVELLTQLEPGPCEALIDPHQFENALINLAVNARHAMPNGGTLTIKTDNITLDNTYAKQHEEVTPGEYVVVTVSDTGAGMPPEVLEKVFDPFFTTKDVGEGSGLGLSMVYGFARQSNGNVTIDSEEGHGTTVKLYLPQSREAVAEKHLQGKTPKAATGSERILLVEDNEAVREVPAGILRNQGYEVVEARDGEEAIKQLKENQSFDLLFTDVVLPGGMNGVEIADEAKRLQPEIKVIYTTGYADDAFSNIGKQVSDAIMINKPYRRAELLEKVQAIFGNGDD